MDSHDAGQLHRCCRCRRGRGHGPPAPTPPRNRRRLSSLSTPLTLLPPPSSPSSTSPLPARLLRRPSATSSSASPPPPNPSPAASPTSASGSTHLRSTPSSSSTLHRPHYRSHPPTPRSPSPPTPPASSTPSRAASAPPSRVARIAKELVDRGLPDIRWIVLGDDDTIFFPQNLLATLRKYDWTKWYYVGARSEERWGRTQSIGLGWRSAAAASPLVIPRKSAHEVSGFLLEYGYAHLYGSDDRVYACLVELGVELTYEPGFIRY
ncbi:hypothetical protein J5N97_000640 [Dioscorea zingiberensis]|uniref:Fringe-like glycosyltransferase domain-containing protein n=1 Tax=Dioscorea zingiberensis TaxID=325984 RepID=A0A9D5H1E9_9LILI|nr:hypothetical protein J5N97_000640 [Dioscorea zingiberensis]